MDQKKRKRILINEITKTVRKKGFEFHSSSYFVRNRGELQDVFFFQFTRDNSEIKVRYGIDCPDLLLELGGNKILSLGNKPKLKIHYHLPLCNQERLGCRYEEHIVSSSIKIANAIESQANSWFYQFITKEDLIEQYKTINIKTENPSLTVPEGKILSWLNYGLMLDDVDDVSSGNWLSPVLNELKSRKKSPKNDEWVRIIESRKTLSRVSKGIFTPNFSQNRT